MNTKAQADFSLDAGWIVPVVPRNRVFTHCSLVVRNDKIVAIVPTSDVDKQFDISTRLDLSGKLLMPGLINCHGHAAMTLMRGYADDLPLRTWLQSYIWPKEKQWVSESFVADGVRLAIAEMQQSGTTCFSDMYFYPESAATVAHELGMRAQLAFPVADVPNNWSRDAEDALHKGLLLRDKYRSNALIDVVFGPHAPYTVSDSILQKIGTLAEELQTHIQIHLHETADEVSRSQSETGQRPIERLRDLGLLSPATQCVHLTQVNTSDIELLTTYGCHVIHCPQSNMKLASGACPTQKLLDAGVNVALGTDGAASNNDLDLFAELQTAALLGKLISGDPAAIDAMTAIEMATINGARALGMDDCIGSLEPGKQADMITIDMTSFASQPLHHPLSQLVYTGTGQRVSDLWIGGEQLMQNHQLVRLNTYELKTTLSQWQHRFENQGDV